MWGPVQTRDSRSMKRIDTLDVIRGIALCGILAANAPTVLNLPAEEGFNDVQVALGLTVHERFFPIFSLLFGLGFGLMLASARRRGETSRWPYVRRFAFLLALGGVHQLLQPGEALLPYALAGLLVLLPASWLPRWGVVAATTVLLPAGVVAGGGFALIPGAFALGLALTAFDVPQRLEQPGAWRTALSLAVVTGAVAALLLPGLAANPGTLGFSMSSTVTGLLMATTYVGLTVALMHTPVRGALVATFGSLGRVSLTNYVGATLLLLAARPFQTQLGIDGTAQGLLRMLALCGGIALLQVVLSRVWLSRFPQGPLEQVWRRVTWGSARPVSRAAAPAPANA